MEEKSVSTKGMYMLILVRSSLDNTENFDSLIKSSCNRKPIAQKNEVN